MSTQLVTPGGPGSGGGVFALGWVSVRDHGAKGDGATDDTAAIDAAIAALVAGGVLYFPRGRYITQGGHVLPVGCTVWGTGRHQTFDAMAQLYLKAGANADMFTIASPHVTIRDLMCYGNKANQSGTSNGIVTDLVTGANYFVLDNVWVESFHDDNIVLQGPATTLSGTITNCESRLAGQYGLHVTGTASDVVISDSYIDQCVNSGVFISAGDISFSNCHVWGNGTGVSDPRDGITLQSADGCRVVNSYVESNTNGKGIYCKTGTNRGHQFIGNNIFNNGGQGIDLFQADHCSIIGNRIYRNNFKAGAGSAGAAILLDGCTAIVTAANTIFDTAVIRQTYGYYEVNTNTDCLYYGNVNRAADHLTGDCVFSGNTIVDFANPNAVTSGESTFARTLATASAVTATGTALLTYFTAARTETVNNIVMMAANTAAAGNTLIRTAVYTVAANGDLTEVAHTNNDTTLFIAQNTIYTKALAASFVKVAGQRYAVLLLVVAGTQPAIVSSLVSTGSFTQALFARSPRLAGKITGLSDLPTSPVANASVANSAPMLYAELTP